MHYSAAASRNPVVGFLGKIIRVPREHREALLDESKERGWRGAGARLPKINHQTFAGCERHAQKRGGDGCLVADSVGAFRPMAFRPAVKFSASENEQWNVN